MITGIFKAKDLHSKYYAIQRENGILSLIRREESSATETPLTSDEMLISELCDTLIPYLKEEK